MKAKKRDKTEGKIQEKKLSSFDEIRPTAALALTPKKEVQNRRDKRVKNTGYQTKKSATKLPPIS